MSITRRSPVGGYCDLRQILEIEGPIKSGSVLAPESPAPTLVPIPRQPQLSWGRHYPLKIMALIRRQIVIPNSFGSFVDEARGALMRTYSPHQIGD
jgi:hypothetical protein